MFRLFKKFGIDIRKEPMPSSQPSTTQNGGVEINANTETQCPRTILRRRGLRGVHGKNRLMGNSQLDIYVFGRRAGKYAAERAKTATIGKLTLAHLDRYDKWLEEAGIRRTGRLRSCSRVQGQKTLEHKLKLL